MTPASRWAIPRPIFLVLASWGLAVLAITLLLSAWIWTNQRHASAERDRIQAEQAAERDRIQVEQDQAMCEMLDLFTSGPAPVAGPAGDRGRAVLKAMTTYRATLDCLPPR